jgi:hypothetical protein
MKKLHKAILEYKFFKLHQVKNTHLIYNELKNEWLVYIHFSKDFIQNNCSFYNVY